MLGILEFKKCSLLLWPTFALFNSWEQKKLISVKTASSSNAAFLMHSDRHNSKIVCGIDRLALAL